ncbi:MAG: TlpA family protein disulfide reductase [Pirellulales bacterium]|nr:TlpA family protein disulfide reductase [Pirellulales bacterium]
MTKSEQVDRPNVPASPASQPVTPVAGQPQPIDEVFPSSVQPDQIDTRTRWCNWTVLAMLVLCIFVITYFRPSGGSGGASGPGIGQTLPKLHLEPLLGSDAPLSLADLTGRVVLINFWKADSAPSEEALPHLAALAEKFRDQTAFRLLSVFGSPDAGADRSMLRRQVREILKSQGVDLTVYCDPDGASRAAVSEMIRADGLPATLLLDRLGRIRGIWIGFRPGMKTRMKQLTAELLAEG